jgi:hypothetical protein
VVNEDVNRKCLRRGCSVETHVCIEGINVDSPGLTDVRLPGSLVRDIGSSGLLATTGLGAIQAPRWVGFSGGGAMDAVLFAWAIQA